MDEREQDEGRTLWQRAQAAIERAFEAFRHDKERPENATLFYEAIGATQQAGQFVRAHPGYVPDTQDGLLMQGAVTGLARAERIEQMHQPAPFTREELARAEKALDADKLARKRGEIPWVDRINYSTPAEYKMSERQERLARMQTVTQDAAQRAPQQTPQEQGIRHGR